MGRKITGEIPYQYKNAPIPGGGYVTGFLFHEKTPEVLYARTDIGGSYRFDYDTKKWISLIESVTGEDLSATYPIALCLDPDYPDRLYIACGVNRENSGKLLVSRDRGETFVTKDIPVRIHGNLSGRGTGCRLIRHPKEPDTLLFASQTEGLWQSDDLGDTWKKLPLPEDYTTFVWVSPDADVMVAGTAGYTTRIDDTMRGHSLYVSYDKGESFEPLCMPESPKKDGSKMDGLVAQRYAFDGTYFYCTLGQTGRWNYIVDLGYSCDTGDMLSGKVLRYPYQNGRLGAYEDISPADNGGILGEFPEYGFGGVDVCKSCPGLVAVSTLCREKNGAEAVYVSRDYGATWRRSLYGLEDGTLAFRTSYMLPKYNGNRSFLHWLSDVKINPFDPNELWFNSGSGVFVTHNLLEEQTVYEDWCDGIEETVHLNVYGLPSGDLQLLDIVGDLGGFAFYDLDKPCDNSFADEEGNRYITCLNADYSDLDTKLGIVTARGNWTGKTKGGLILTRDGFKTFEHLPMPYGITKEIDETLQEIEKPNVNPGWVAMSPDGQNIVWSAARFIWLPTDRVICSHDGGKSFVQVQVYDTDKRPVQIQPLADDPEHPGQLKGSCFKAYSDRKNSQLFYGFDEKGGFYVSRDGGEHFYEKNAGLPKVHFGLIDTMNATEIRGISGESGIFYMALGVYGMKKLVYDEATDTVTVHSLTQEGESVLRLGLGIGEKKESFGPNNLGIYLCGSIEGAYGFYRTFDEGKTYSRLNTDKQMYGEINSIDGDKRKFGRFFLATGSRGVMYGEEV